jgi:hypothetical protein
MSSSNLVRVAFIEESTYGVTPGAGNFETARFTSENLSGTPDTVESQQIRTDRMSSGQVVTGLQVAGDLQIELAKESQFEELLESVMYSTWNTQALQTVDFDVDATAKTLTRGSGDWNATLVVGDFITLAGFSNAGNNVQVMITDITSTTVVEYAGPAGMVTEVGSGTTYKRGDKIGIGTTKKSFSIEKKFTDLTTKGINYRGMICSRLDLNVVYGELATGAIGFSGNDYVTADTAGELMTNARTVNAPATSQTLNGSVDMPFLTTSASGSFDSTLAVRSINMTLNNNLTAQTVIGDIAPIDYSAGTAAIEISISVYNNDASWSLLGNKLTQDPFGIGFQLKNNGGWYAFYIPQVQVSFEDPSSAGQNQDITLEMSGTAKIGATGESAITIYRS